MPRRSPRRRPAVRSQTPARWPPWVLMGLVLGGLAAIQFHFIVFALPSKTFYSGDCGTKLLQAQSLSMQRWRNASVVYPGKQIDPQLRFVQTGMLQVRKGRVWGVHSLAFALPASLAYSLLGYRGLYLVPAVSLLAALFLLWLVAKGIYSAWRALLVLLLAGFCSPLLFYSVEFWEHTLAVLLSMAALLLLSAGAEVTRRPWRLAGAGALLGIAVGVRPEALVLAAATVVALAAVVRPGCALRASLALLGIGIASALAPQAALNHRLFGDPLGTAFALHLHGGNSDPRLLVLGKMLMPLSTAAFLKLASALLAALLLWWLSRREDAGRRGRLTTTLSLLAGAIMATLAAVEANRLLALWRQPAEVTTLTGSFPVIWAFPMLAVLWRRSGGSPNSSLLRFLAVTAAVYVAGVLITSPTWAGAQWGPRLLLPALPLLALLAFNVPRPTLASGRVALFTVCLLGLISGGIQLTGLTWLGKVKSLYVNTVNFVERETHEGDVLVSDQFWFHEVLASKYYERRFFYISSPALMTDFVGRLRTVGVPRFYYLLPRSVEPDSGREQLNQDLVTQAKAHNLLGQGLTLDSYILITDMPYYLLRLSTGAASP